jgi:CRP-like cAMP-binding protein
VIAHVGQGAIIGEMALIDSEPRMATARAASKTSVTVIPSKELEIRMERLAKFDPVPRRLVGMMVQRMRDAKFTSADS